LYVILFGDFKSITKFCLENFKQKAVKALGCGLKDSIKNRFWGEGCEELMPLILQCFRTQSIGLTWDKKQKAGLFFRPSQVRASTYDSNKSTNKMQQFHYFIS
jgi:hypothetical protein